MTVTRETNTQYTSFPEQNGVSERLNGILLEKFLVMLHASGLTKFLWAEAIRHAVWLKNCTSTKALNGRTPHEVVYGKKPNLSGLHEWGSRVWVHDNTSSKLDGRAKEGHWMGFDDESKGHQRHFLPKKRSILLQSLDFFRLEGGVSESIKAIRSAYTLRV